MLTLSTFAVSASVAAVCAGPVAMDLTLRPGYREDRRLLDSPNEALVYGDVHSSMVYHVDVLVGTPGQMQSLIVDTGSGLTAFPCTGCTDCGQHIDPPFEPQASSTFQWLDCSEAACFCELGACKYALSYVEGSSIQGRFFKDVLHLGRAIRRNTVGLVHLGCHSSETKLFKTQKPSGIMGLSHDQRWDVLEALAEGVLEKQIIALCFSPEGGVMSFGGVNATWTPTDSALQWIPYTRSYDVSVERVEIIPSTSSSNAASWAVVFDSTLGKFHVDSGTTFTYFTQAQNDALRVALENVCQGGACGGAQRQNSCWLVAPGGLDDFPVLRFTLGATTYDWGPRGYLYQFRGGGDWWCYAFRGDPPLTLGASFMRHHLVVFDRDQRLIGHAPSSCPSTTSRSDVVAHSPIVDIALNTNADALSTTSGVGSARGANFMIASILFAKTLLYFIQQSRYETCGT